MTQQDHHFINPTYDQDWINGVTQKEYAALFTIIDSILNQKSDILDLAGGSGRLALMLREHGYEANLLEWVEGLALEGIKNGLPKENVFIADILDKDSVSAAVGTRKFSSIVIKSSSHEFTAEKIEIVFMNAYNLLKEGGYIFDWDVHEPDESSATWLKRWVNIKDNIANELPRCRAYGVSALD